MDIYPAIDLRDGRCVRLIQGDYDRQLNYSDDPISVAKSFVDAGAGWIHVVDLDGAKEGRSVNGALIERLIKSLSAGTKVQVGGGLREKSTIQSLVDAGAARVVVGTRALEDRDWFDALLAQPALIGRVALGLDAKDGMVAVRGWTDSSGTGAIDFAREMDNRPLAALIYTDIAKDGMLAGPNIAAMRQMASAVSLPVIASGGVSSTDDVKALAALPLAGMIIGRALYEGTITVEMAIQIASNQDKGNQT